MSLDRHGCKLQVDWLVEAYNHEAVFLVYHIAFSFKETSCNFFVTALKSAKQNLTFCCYCLSAFSAQMYAGRKRAAVDRICVGVPAGEVKSLSLFTSRATALFLFPIFKISLFVLAQVNLHTD